VDITGEHILTIPVPLDFTGTADAVLTKGE